VVTSVGGDLRVHPQLAPVRLANLIFVMSRGPRRLYFLQDRAGVGSCLPQGHSFKSVRDPPCLKKPLPKDSRACSCEVVTIDCERLPLVGVRRAGT